MRKITVIVVKAYFLRRQLMFANGLLWQFEATVLSGYSFGYSKDVELQKLLVHHARTGELAAVSFVVLLQYIKIWEN